MNDSIPVIWWVMFSAILFGIGLYGLFTRRNAVAVLMSIELLLNAANINFVVFWRYMWSDTIEGMIFVLVTVMIAAAEAAIGLAIVLAVFRMFQSIQLDEIREMRG